MNPSAAIHASSQSVMQGTIKGRIARKAAGYAASALLAFSPMLAGPARAQTPPATQVMPPPTQPEHPNYIESGTRLRISDGKISPLVNVVNRKNDLVPSIGLNGPAKLSVRFYPAISLKRFENGETEVPISVAYSVAPEEGKPKNETYEGISGPSAFRSGELKPTLAIGTPINIVITVPAGKHTVSILSPNGFLEVVGVERIVKKPPQSQPKKEIVKPAPTIPKTVPKPVIPKEPCAFPRFSLDAERTQFRNLGPSNNSGDLNLASATGYVPLRRGLALNAGVMFSSFGLSLGMPEAVTGLRSFSADATAGIALSRGKHRAIAGAFGGYRAILNDVNSNTDPHHYAESNHQFEFGGRAGYAYGERFEILVSGGNNPFIPISGKIRAALPFGWVKGSPVWLELDAMWLHTMKPIEEEGRKGGGRLGDNNAYARLAAGIPIWRIGRFVPSAIVAGELDAAGAGVHRADALVGGAVSFESKMFRILCGGGASPLTGYPFFLLRVLYK